MARRSSSRKAARSAKRTRNHRTTKSTIGRPFYRRQLRLEPLEDRRLLALVTVTTLEDSVNFNDGVTSLREAIFAANTVQGADTIEFAPALTAGGPATILLTQGELQITDSLTIIGPGAELLAIDASGYDPTPDVDDRQGSRVARIYDPSGFSDVRVSLIGLTFTGGDTIGPGGAIYVTVPLSMENCVIRENAAGVGGGGGVAVDFFRSGGSVDAWEAKFVGCDFVDNTIPHFGFSKGGGLSAVGLQQYLDTILIDDCNFVGNIAGNGGGLNLLGFSSAKIVNSTLVDNWAVLGGAISARDVTIESSLIHSNTARRFGGGIVASGSSIVINSTISENISHGSGASYDAGGAGGIANTGDLAISHSTIVNNSAAIQSAAGSIKAGGGIGGSPFTLDHTIVAGNTRGIDAVADDIVGKVTLSYSLLGSESGSLITDLGGNVIGTESVPIDPMLGPLADNGGPMWTHALLAGSPAINAGDLNAAAGEEGVPEFDQRGEPFGRIVGGRIDIGAFEHQTPTDLNLLVDTLADESDGDYSRGDLSLREAIELSNASNYEGVVDTIRFDPALWATGTATILLTQGELSIADSLTIEGPGAEWLTIDGDDKSRVLHVDDEDADVFIDVAIEGLSITGGRAVGLAQSGAGIQSVENLTLTYLVLHHNAASSGGAVAGSGGNIRIVACTISDNTAVQAGGGATLSGRYVEVVDSVFVRNTTRFNGGGGLFLAADGGEFVRIEGTKFDENRVTEMLTRGGGGLYASASGVGTRIEIIGCEVSNNHAESVAVGGEVAEGGGIRLRVSTDATALVTATTFANNTAGAANRPGSGGGLYVEALSGSAVIEQSTFQDNTSSRYGGGIFAFSWQSGSILVNHCEMSRNSAIFGGGGDFASGNNGRVKITDSVFSLNTAETGGGLRWRHETGPNDPGIVRTTIDGNLATNGGGIYSTVEGNLGISHSTISNNLAELGGGVYVAKGVDWVNVTVSGNRANVGGGVFASSGHGSIRHSTIAANTTQGLGHGIYLQSGPLAVENSIVASNTGSTLGDIVTLGSGAIVARYSLIGNAAGSNLTPTIGGIPDANGNLIGINASSINPRLSALSANGGPTMTHALLPGSPAMNAGDPAAVAGVNGVPEFDQRGAPFGRVFGGRIDMGAVESQPNPLAGDYNFDGVVDSGDYTIWRNTLNSTTDLRADGDGSGKVGPEDYQVWKRNFGASFDVAQGREQGAHRSGSATWGSGQGALHADKETWRQGLRRAQPSGDKELLVGTAGSEVGRLQVALYQQTAERDRQRESWTGGGTLQEFDRARRERALEAWLSGGGSERQQASVDCKLRAPAVESVDSALAEWEALRLAFVRCGQSVVTR